ncbi:MAG: non-heme iron oxygenase ferredoxin subunit [Gammaproteobacteria bacterium]|jgi:3-phenylpropionate/trans-cinnamate dioxygenase ferredoxin subunit
MSDWIDVAATEEIAPDGCIVVDVDGVPVAVFNVQGEFLAIEDECSHEACPLSDGEVESDTIICDRHGARFSLRTGEALSAPAFEPVARFPVRVDDGRVQVRASPED